MAMAQLYSIILSFNHNTFTGYYDSNFIDTHILSAIVPVTGGIKGKELLILHAIF